MGKKVKYMKNITSIENYLGVPHLDQSQSFLQYFYYGFHKIPKNAFFILLNIFFFFYCVGINGQNKLQLIKIGQYLLPQRGLKRKAQFYKVGGTSMCKKIET